jgi:hypothetical protein
VVGDNINEMGSGAAAIYNVRWTISYDCSVRPQFPKKQNRIEGGILLVPLAEQLKEPSNCPKDSAQSEECTLGIFRKPSKDKFKYGKASGAQGHDD